MINLILIPRLYLLEIVVVVGLELQVEAIFFTLKSLDLEVQASNLATAGLHVVSNESFKVINLLLSFGILAFFMLQVLEQDVVVGLVSFFC